MISVQYILLTCWQSAKAITLQATHSDNLVEKSVPRRMPRGILFITIQTEKVKAKYKRKYLNVEQEGVIMLFGIASARPYWQRRGGSGKDDRTGTRDKGKRAYDTNRLEINKT